MNTSHPETFERQNLVYCTINSIKIKCPYKYVKIINYQLHFVFLHIIYMVTTQKVAPSKEV